MKRYNVLDIETQKLDNEVGGWSLHSKHRMLIACAVIHSFNDLDDTVEKSIYTDTMNVTGRGPVEIDNMGDLRQLHEFLVQMKRDNMILGGHNIIDFDIPVMYGHFRTLGFQPLDFATTNVVDTMDTRAFQHRVKLHDLAEENIGRGKSGSGALAPVLWKQQKFEEVIKYCDNDVDITTLIYKFYLKNGYVLHNGRQVKVNWPR